MQALAKTTTNGWTVEITEGESPLDGKGIYEITRACDGCEEQHGHSFRVNIDQAFDVYYEFIAYAATRPTSWCGGCDADIDFHMALLDEALES